MKVLVVEDETPIAEALAYNLRQEGYLATTASTGEDGLRQASANQPDLVILDLMLPGIGGLEVCRMLRKKSSVPIIMLTAKAEETDRVVGLEIGADDYVVKPFSMRELMARVKSVLRRKHAGSSPDDRIEVADIVVDIRRHVATVGGKRVRLTRKEFGLLAHLAANPDQVFTRAAILDRVWGPQAFVEERTVDVHVRWLRQKIESDPSHPRRLVTVRGVGYKLSGEA